MVAHALALGFAGFDTAAAYGNGDSELMLGRALRGRLDRGLICTKFGAGTSSEPVEPTAAELTTAIDGSLRRLNVEHIDVMMIHRLDDGTPIEVFLSVLERALAAGKIGAVASSSMGGDLVLELHLAAKERGLQIRYEQVKYSMIDRSCEATHLPVARRCGINPMFYGVLDEGVLAAIEHRLPGRGPGRPALAADIHPWPVAAQRSLELRRSSAASLRDVAQSNGLTLTDLAIAFVCGAQGSGGRRPSVVLGASGVEQLSTLARASMLRLDPAIRDQIDQIVTPGTSIGIPDRSRMRRDLLRLSAADRIPLTVGDPRSGLDTT